MVEVISGIEDSRLTLDLRCNSLTLPTQVDGVSFKANFFLKPKLVSYAASFLGV
jgi:hypothetical protein